MSKRLIPYKLFWVLIIAANACCGQHANSPAGRALWTVDISHDDKYIAVGGDDSLLRIFTNDLTLYKWTKVDHGMIRAVQWHPKENLLAVAARNGIWLYYPEMGKEIQLEGDHKGSRTIAWNYNGELVAAAAGSGKIWIWNKQGKLLRTIQKTDESGIADKKDFLGLDWHPSKNILTTVGDEIRIFDTSGKQLNVFKHREQRAGLLTVKWHPSGDFFVTGDYGHINEAIPTLLQFWQPDGKLLREWSGSKMEFRNIRWNKQGSYLATASDVLRIWTKEGNLLYTGAQAGNQVLWGVDWINDSKKIVTVSFDSGNIQLWDDKAKLLKTIN